MRLKITTTIVSPGVGVVMCPLNVKIYPSRKLDGILWCKIMLENNGSVDKFLLIELVIGLIIWMGDSIPREFLTD